MLVKDVMRRQVITVKESTTLKELMRIFQKYPFHHLPVVKEDGTVVGIVALEDILKIFEPFPPYLMEMLRRNPFYAETELEETNLFKVDLPPEMGVLCVAEDLMNMNVVTIKEDATAMEALSRIRSYNLKTLPVVDEDGRLQGIVNLFDILMGVLKEKGIF